MLKSEYQLIYIDYRHLYRWLLKFIYRVWGLSSGVFQNPVVYKKSPVVYKKSVSLLFYAY